MKLVIVGIDHLFRLHNWDVEHVATATDAQHIRCDALLTALHLPDGTGFDLLSRPEPVIFLTGEGSETVAVRAIKAGAADYIPWDEHVHQRLYTALKQVRRGPAPETPTHHIAELERSKQWIQLILDNTSDAIVFTTDDGRIRQANQRFKHLFGYTGDAYYNLPLTDCFPAAASLEAAIQEGRSDRLKLLACSQAGHCFHTEVVMRPISDEEVASGILFTIRNVEEQYRAYEKLRESEQNLRASEERHREVTDLMSDYAYSVTQVDDGSMRIDWITEAPFSRLTGYSLANGVKVEDVLAKISHPQDRERSVRQLEASFNGQVTEGTFRLLTAGGDLRWVYITRKPIWDEEAGRYTRVLGAVRDITEQRASEARFRAIAETVPVAIIVYSRDSGDLIYANNETGRLLDTSVTDLLGVSTEAVLGSSAYRQVMEKMHAGQGDYREIQLGDETWASVTSTPIVFDGEQAVLSALYDVTDIHLTEEALRVALSKEREVNEMKSRFVSMVSHEFRTPLATIQASAESLQAYWERMNDEQRDKRFGKIRAQVDHMTSMLEDVLTIGRFEAGRVEFDASVVDLPGFVGEIAEDFEQTFPLHTFVYNRVDEKLLIEADTKLLRQIVTNLLSNARKYSDAGSTVHIGITRQEMHAVLTVTDEGIGIPTENLSSLFSAFYRADNVGTIQGNGLGLAITKQAIELHGGSITVTSEVGQGTTFTVSFPLEVGQFIDSLPQLIE